MTETAYCTPGQEVNGWWVCATACGTVTLWLEPGTAPHFGLAPPLNTDIKLQSKDTLDQVSLTAMLWTPYSILATVPIDGPGSGAADERFTITIPASDATFVVDDVCVVSLPGSNGYPPGPPVHQLASEQAGLQAAPA